MEIVRLTNVSENLWQDHYGSVPYVCPPGQSIIVPVEAVWLWFGNPNLTDKPIMAQYDRRDEFQRVIVRNGFDKLQAASEPYDLALPVTLETMEGDRYITVIEDPAGDESTLKGVAAQGLDSSEAVAQELEILKKNQAALLARLEELQDKDNTAPGSLDDIPEDNPTKVPVGAAGGQQE